MCFVFEMIICYSPLCRNLGNFEYVLQLLAFNSIPVVNILLNGKELRKRLTANDDDK